MPIVLEQPPGNFHHRRSEEAPEKDRGEPFGHFFLMARGQNYDRHFAAEATKKSTKPNRHGAQADLTAGARSEQARKAHFREQPDHDVGGLTAENHGEVQKEARPSKLGLFRRAAHNGSLSTGIFVALRQEWMESTSLTAPECQGLWRT